MGITYEIYKSFKIQENISEEYFIGKVTEKGKKGKIQYFSDHVLSNDVLSNV